MTQTEHFCTRRQAGVGVEPWTGVKDWQDTRKIPAHPRCLRCSYANLSQLMIWPQSHKAAPEAESCCSVPLVSLRDASTMQDGPKPPREQTFPIDSPMPSLCPDLQGGKPNQAAAMHSTGTEPPRRGLCPSSSFTPRSREGSCGRPPPRGACTRAAGSGMLRHGA